MKQFMFGILAALFALPLHAQVASQPVVFQNYVPTGACTLPNNLHVVTINPGAGVYQCIASAWVVIGPAASGGATIAHTTNLIAGDGAGNGVSAEIAVASIPLLSTANTFTGTQTWATDSRVTDQGGSAGRALFGTQVGAGNPQWLFGMYSSGPDFVFFDGVGSNFPVHIQPNCGDNCFVLGPTGLVVTNKVTSGSLALRNCGTTSTNSIAFCEGFPSTDTTQRRVGTLAQTSDAVTPFVLYETITGNASAALAEVELQTALDGNSNTGILALQLFGGKLTGPTVAISANDTELATTAAVTAAGYATLVSPSFTTPTLGVATATTVNKVTITAPATSATLTLVQGSTLTLNGAFNTQFTGSGNFTFTLPGASDTLVGLAASQTLTSKTLTSPTISGGGTINSATIGQTTPAAGSFTALKGTTLLTTTTCGAVGTSASPSLVACAAAAAGVFSCAITASAATCVISDTAVTANSTILVTPISYAGTRLSVTCNTAPTATAASVVIVSAISAGTSFTINVPTITTNPACYSYSIIN